MRKGDVYPALAQALEQWRSRPVSEVVARVDAVPDVHEFQIEGETVQIEVSVTWADAKRSIVLVEAIAYGPSSWLTQKAFERLLICVVGDKGDAQPALQPDA